MAIVRTFKAIRPAKGLEDKIAALPYDVYNREEAKAEVEKSPLSFLRIDRAETQFGDEVSTYAPEVYKKAHDILWEMVKNGQFIEDDKECYYIYELVMDKRSQVGIVACSSIDDYENGVIKKHENTRAEKEKDRINHVDICGAQTGPIFLAYRSDDAINNIIAKTMQSPAEYDFTSDDGITHRVWVISDDSDIEDLKEAFSNINDIYIADGHHRAASAVKVGLKRRQENPGYTGDEEFNFFLSVLFPDEQLKILDYNRVVKDLNGMSEEEFLSKVGDVFDIKPAKNASPDKKAHFGMYLSGKWYDLAVRKEDITDDPVEGLDVSYLQNLLLGPVLGIRDPKTDERIDFVGGIRGTKELERRCGLDAKVAFSMYPTSIGELFAVA
nr:DUF1015 domain-containing protein [Eubacterium sp.]